MWLFVCFFNNFDACIYCRHWLNRCTPHRIKIRKTIKLCAILIFCFVQSTHKMNISIIYATTEYNAHSQCDNKFRVSVFLSSDLKVDLTLWYSRSNCEYQPFNSHSVFVCNSFISTTNYLRAFSYVCNTQEAKKKKKNVKQWSTMKFTYFFFIFFRLVSVYLVIIFFIFSIFIWIEVD